MKNTTSRFFLFCVIFFLWTARNISAQTTDTFNYVSDTIQTWTVPPCVTQVTVKLWAAGGGGGNNHGYSFEYTGGSGSYYEGVISGLTPGTTVLDLYVPSGGKYSDTLAGGAGGWPGGGQGGNDTLNSGFAGGGGGYAAIEIAGTYFVLAGAAGGGGDCPSKSCYGGGGGATQGMPGGNGLQSPGGWGATISTGGAVGYSFNLCDPGTAGAAFTGGMGGGLSCNFPTGVQCLAGGGGGAGYYGGGGAGDNGGGGGGGSSYPASTFISGGITFTLGSNLYGNYGNNRADYLAPGGPPAGIGFGGYLSNGGNGLITITYTRNAAPLTAVISVQTPPTCGICNGSLMVTPSGGGSPYTYLWAPGGQTNQTATGLCAGTYTVTIKDPCGDIYATSLILTDTSLAVTTNVTANEKCNGDCTGIATASVSIGSPPYAYVWTPLGGSNATAIGLCAGNYSITVTDSKGCTGSATATITQPPAIIVTDTILTNPICYGGTGSASVAAGGGISPYTYLWTPTAQTNATATGLLAGIYTVMVTDSNRCTATATTTITQPSQVVASINITANILCNGGTGDATVTVGGGTPNYTYLWTPTGQTTALATGLSARTYTVNVTDANGCTGTASITITQPTLLTATMGVVNNVLCNEGVGNATVIPVGGTLPYTYSWSPLGGSNAMGTGLMAASYTVTVTDNNHCTASATVTITQPAAALSTSVTATTNISCYNDNDGGATVAATGGTSPYAYLWTPSNYTTASPNNLFALTYTVTVTDAHGCTATANTTLTQPALLTVAITEPKIICKDSTGNILGNTNGGTAPYTYAWSGGVTSTTSTATITPVITNDYSVTVTDVHGCTATANILLQYGPNLIVTITGKNSVCTGSSTTLCADAAGGQGGNSYLWEPENTTNECITISPGSASVYTLTVIDGCGVTTTTSTTVYTNPSPAVSMSSDINQGCVPLCVQFHNATTLAHGGILQYVWKFGNGDTTQTQNPIYCYQASGVYNVSLTAISDSGCSATLDKVDMISVYKLPIAAFTYSPQPATIQTPTVQFTNESIDMYGIAYWWWNFGDGNNSTSILENPSYTYKDTGTYCANLIVMDEHGCMDTATNCLVMGPAFKLYIPSAFTPNGDGMDDIFKPVGEYISSFEMYIFDRWGMKLYQTTDLNEGWNGKVNGTGSIYQEDTYIYKINVTDSEGTQHSYVGNVTLIK